MNKVPSSLQIKKDVTPAHVKTSAAEVHCHAGDGFISSDEGLSKMELKIKEQGKKLDRFETAANENRKTIHQLRMRVEMLEASEADNVGRTNEKLLGRKERPATRLLRSKRSSKTILITIVASKVHRILELSLII